MKTLLFRTLLMLSFGAAAVWAADFWEKKKFSEWTQKDVQKMLTDSPWARPVEIRMDALGGRPAGGGAGGRRRGGAGIPSDSAGGLGGTDEPGMRGGGPRGLDTPEPVPTLTVHVRWHSALPIKQAIARARFGDEVTSSPEAAKILGRQETRYIVGVAGLPPQVVRGNPADLKSNASLKIKGKPPVAPENVQGDRDRGRVNLYLFFPRAQDGNPLITAEDGEVEVLLKLGQINIKRKFKLKDMVYDGKLEI